MNSYIHAPFSAPRVQRSPVPGVLLMVGALLASVYVFLSNSETGERLPYFFLVPWIIGFAFLLMLPIAYLHFQGKLLPYNPLVYYIAISFFPGYVIGGFGLAAGWTEPFFMHYIQDKEYTLPYTLVLVAIGFVGLAFGFLSPFGHYAGGKIEKLLPVWNVRPEVYIIPGLVLLFIGALCVALATSIGVAGFQSLDNRAFYDSLIGMTTIFFGEAAFILMYVLFKRKQYDFLFILVAGLTISMVLLRSAFAGNKGILLVFVTVFSLAYFFADPKITKLRLMTVAVLAGLAVIIGMAFGTTFRQIKGTETKVSIDKYSESVASTVGKVGTSNPVESLDLGLKATAERIDLLSSLAVSVSSYERLVPYEPQYGLDNNIVRDLSTFWIPRVLWHDKPSESSPRAYADLYFNYGENSFVITPMVDLLRNFGILGILVGMFVLGFVLRTIYRALVEDQPLITWRLAVFVVLLTGVNYEAFYVSIYSTLLKAGFISIIGILIVYCIAHLLGTRPENLKRLPNTFQSS